MSLLSLKFLTVISVFISSFVGVAGIRKLALKRMILDIPNERSSHETPTPRGGGAAIMITAIVFTGAVYFVLPITVFGSDLFVPAQQDLMRTWLLVLGLGGAAVGLIGWFDDCYGLPVILRFGVHFLAAAWAVYLLAPWEASIVLKGFLLVWVAWTINYFNFMDGIDGLAATEAVMVGMGGAAIAAKHGQITLELVSMIVALSSLGFLVWNWPPAKIFMGDVGSGFLGYTFGCLSISAGWGFDGGFGTWTILLLLFLLDATITLLRRIVNGEKFWKSHRTHFYQKAVQSGYSHRQVVLFFILGFGVLFPISYFLK